VSERRRVLFLADQLGNGGAERQLALTARELPGNWERLVWAHKGGPYAAVIERSGVEIDCGARAWRHDPRRLTDLWRVARTYRPSVIHSWGWTCSAAVGPECRLAGMPLVDGTIRNATTRTYRSTGRRFGIAFADLVVANSQAGLDAWGIDGRRGRVVFNGFDAQRLVHCGDSTSGQTEAPFVVCMIARMGPDKDFRSLLSAARRLALAEPGEWRFVAIGDGPQRDHFIALAGDLIEKGTVEFAAGGLEPLGFLGGAHVGVLMTSASEGEGIPNAVMEYMSLGMPVVCSDSGGTTELVVPGETGLIVPPEDAQALVEALIYLKENRDERARLGAAGRARLAERFSVDRMVHDTVAVYEEAIARRSRRRQTGGRHA